MTSKIDLVNKLNRSLIFNNYRRNMTIPSKMPSWHGWVIISNSIQWAGAPSRSIFFCQEACWTKRLLLAGGHWMLYYRRPIKSIHLCDGPDSICGPSVGKFLQPSCSIWLNMNIENHVWSAAVTSSMTSSTWKMTFYIIFGSRNPNLQSDRKYLKNWRK